MTISDTAAGSSIYYTTDGSQPSSGSTPYTAPVALSGAETLRAIAYVTGFEPSTVTSASYTLQAATPVLSLASGTYAPGTTVTLFDGPTYGSIYYTTDGNPPGPGSTLYTGPITINASETIQAIAVAPSLLNSAVASATYTVAAAAATPVITPAAGNYESNPSISISDSNSGATIFYTTNGSTPTTASSVYAGSFTVAPSAISTVTVKAIAVAPGNAASSVASATFTITTTNSQLTIVSSNDPYTLACAIAGPALTGNPGFSGTVTFTDATTNTTLGTAPVGASTANLTIVPVMVDSAQGYDGVAATADFNGDGIPDLVEGTGTSLVIYLGNGDGTFRRYQTVDLTTYSLSSSMVENILPLDFNGMAKSTSPFSTATRPNWRYCWAMATAHSNCPRRHTQCRPGHTGLSQAISAATPMAIWRSGFIHSTAKC